MYDQSMWTKVGKSFIGLLETISAVAHSSKKGGDSGAEGEEITMTQTTFSSW